MFVLQLLQVQGSLAQPQAGGWKLLAPLTSNRSRPRNLQIGAAQGEPRHFPPLFVFSIRFFYTFYRARGPQHY